MKIQTRLGLLATALLTTLVTVSAVVAGAATDPAQATTPPDQSKLDLQAAQKALAVSQVATAQNTFGGKMFGEMAKANSGNLFFSPLSASMALSMTVNGARGMTATAMQSALQLGTMSPDVMNLGNSGLMQSLNQKSDGFTVQVANSMWIKEGFSVYPAFVKEAQDSYQADVQNIDFTLPTASTTINSWVSTKTNGKIDSIVPSKIAPDTRLILINATYLKAEWVTPFNARNTRDSDFTLADGTKKQVKSMSAVSDFNYAETADYQAVELPYKGGSASMIVVLPKSGKRPQVEQALSDKLISDLNQTFTPATQSQYGTLQLPKFLITSETDLGASLKALGMGVAFTQSADFGAISGSPLQIDKVLQKIYIAIDEKGTEAAAVTAITVGAAMAHVPPPQQFTMIVDQPFYILIRDLRSNAVLFEGRVTNPAP